MLVMLENVRARIARNAEKGRATWLYIDECHVLLGTGEHSGRSEYSGKFLYSLWKKVRKQGGLCTAITQNISDMLQNYTAVTMLANSEFIALLKQANMDSQELSRVAGIPEAQLKYVNGCNSGMGILKHGEVIIPFDARVHSEQATRLQPGKNVSYQRTGGGGTCFQAIFDWLQKQHVSRQQATVVILTDGWGESELAVHGYRNVLWLLSTESELSVKSPVMHSVKIGGI